MAWLQGIENSSILLAVMAMGVACGLLGSYLVVQRLALVGDTIAHAILPGLVLGLVWSPEKNTWFVFLICLIVGGISMALIEALEATTRIKRETILGIVLSGFFGLGVFLESIYQPTGVRSFLYGQLAALDSNDLAFMLWVMFAIIAIIFLGWRAFYAFSFDRVLARNLGFPLVFLRSLFSLLLMATIIASLQAVGVILVSAMLIVPAMTALILVKRFLWLQVIAVIIACFSGFVGIASSSHYDDLPTGAIIVIATGACFILALLGKGIVSFIVKFKQSRRV